MRRPTFKCTRTPYRVEVRVEIRGMKLGKKSASLLDEFKSDAYQVEEPQAAVQAGPAEALSLILEEKVTCYLRKDGGMDGLEVQLRRSRLSFTGHAQGTSERLSGGPASWSRESLDAVPPRRCRRSACR